jgi:arginine/lysine/ornithine decarboxylase
MARNCNKSVYNAVVLNGLRPVYLTPDVDEVSGICEHQPEQVRAGGQKSRAKL